MNFHLANAQNAVVKLSKKRIQLIKIENEENLKNEDVDKQKH